MYDTLFTLFKTRGHWRLQSPKLIGLCVSVICMYFISV